MSLFGRTSISSDLPWKDPQLARRVCRQIRTQRVFTRGYSPLYSSLLNCTLQWLAEPDKAVARVGEASRTQLLDFGHRLLDYAAQSKRGAMQDSLAFGAALHSFLLAKDPRVASLATYYASVGGSQSGEEASFETDLLTALGELGGELFERASQWGVQTNESSRGLSWLLPATVLGIDAAHLVELGASAGLNLYAEQRRYRLAIEGDQGTTTLDLGAAGEREFVIPCGVDASSLSVLSKLGSAPKILSRAGADLAPMDLLDPQAELYLKACVWGDQPTRLARLIEGIAVHRRVVRDSPGDQAQLHTARLPDDLEGFLARAIPRYPQGPVIVYNTYVTEYFNDVAERSLDRQLKGFARRFSVQTGLPLMWVRFEPPRAGEPSSVRRGWCRWQVDLFTGSQHRCVDLGWAHPHFTQAIIGPGLAQLLAITQ